MQRVAVIDLGTNTFNLLIADTDGHGFFSVVYNEKLPVKLGEGGINSGVIIPAAYQRGLEAMETYNEAVRSWQANKTIAFATSAVRNASNGQAFVKDVLDRTGIQIQVISGAQEAELIYQGVSQALKFSSANSLIMDIGGGSTEFIIANEKGLVWKQSFEVGASRLLQKFTPSDPITSEETGRINDYLKEILQPLLLAVKQYPVEELIGASGSFESLAEMIVHRYYGGEENYDTEFTFDLEHCEAIHRELLASTREERLRIKGLVAMRVDMIVISAILVEFVVREIGIGRMRLSAYALKEGALVKFMQGN